MDKPTMQVKVDGELQEREYYYETNGSPYSALWIKIPVIEENERLIYTIAGGPEIMTLWR